MRARTVVCLCAFFFIAGCTITLNLTRIDNNASCTTPSPFRQGSSPLFILILSSPANFDQRTSIRQTWLSLLPSNTKARFVIGTKNLDANLLSRISEESSSNNDLLILEYYQDSYSELTTKLLLTFSSISEENFNYLLKVDDDSYVNIVPLVKELGTVQRSLYWGYFRGDAHIKSRGLWREKDWNICDRYLPYAHGGGYVLSIDLVQFIVANREKLRKFRSEDVSVGAWLATIDTNRKHDVRFDTEFRSRGCLNSNLVMHKQSPEDMTRLHENLIRKGALCENERLVYPAFQYDWDNLPSKCCIK